MKNYTTEDERKGCRSQLLFMAFRHGLIGCTSSPHSVTIPILALINEIPEGWKRKMIAETETAVEDGLTEFDNVGRDDTKTWQDFVKELKESMNND